MKRPYPALILGLLCAAVGFGLGRMSIASGNRRETAARRAGIADPSVSHEEVPGGGPVNSMGPPPDLLLAEQAVPSRRRDENLLRSLAAWAARDPLSALAYAQHALSTGVRTQAVTAVLTVWADRSPEAAWKWALANDGESGAPSATVLSEVGMNDVALAAKFADLLAAQRPGHEQEIYTAALGGMTSGGNYEAAHRLAEDAGSVSDEQRGQLIDIVASQWANYQPDKAAAWVQGLPAGAVRDQALLGVCSNWPEGDPAGAAGFAMQLPAGTLRESALKQTVTRWAEADPERAGSWLSQFGPNDDFDQAAAAIATAPKRLSGNVQLALSWANVITDDQLRLQSLNSILSTWSERDAASARSYMQTSEDLEPSLRAKLLNQFVRTDQPAE